MKKIYLTNWDEHNIKMQFSIISCYTVYSGVQWFRALYMSIALLYARRLLTGCHSKSLNINADGVS